MVHDRIDTGKDHQKQQCREIALGDTFFNNIHFMLPPFRHRPA